MKLLRKENSDLRFELEEAAKIANLFQSKDVPHWPSIELDAFSESLFETGGDWFDFHANDDEGIYHVILCDISGHGVQAAIVVSTCQSLLNKFRLEDHHIKMKSFGDHFFKSLNGVLYKNGQGHHTTTCLILTIDLQKNTATLINSALPHPIFIKAQDVKKYQRLRANHALLGLNEEYQVGSKEFSFDEGDTILLYTDGIPLPNQTRKLGPILDGKKLNTQTILSNLSEFPVQQDDKTLLVVRLFHRAKKSVLSA